MKKILFTIGCLVVTFSSAQTWNTSGNNGTNPSTDFLGTIDAQPLIFRTNNSEKVRITLNGNIGVGISEPKAKFDVENRFLIGEGAPVWGTAILAHNTPWSRNYGFSSPDGLTRYAGFGAHGSGTGSNLDFLWIGSDFDTSNVQFNIVDKSSVFYGNVGIGSSNPQQKLSVNGNILTGDTATGLGGTVYFGNPSHGLTRNGNDIILYTHGGDGNLIFKTLLDQERMRVASNGNIGIGTMIPEAKLHIAGNLKIDNIQSSTSSIDQALVIDPQGFVKKTTSTNNIQNNNIYNNILYYQSGCAVINNGIKIKTNIPFPASGSGGEMPTVNIEGFAYGEEKTIGININWYVWQNQFYLTSNVSSYGGHLPIVKLANENGKVVIFLDDKTYCINFGVKAIGGSDPSYYQGWTVVDEPITGSITKTLAYKNAFGNVKVDGKLEAKEIKVTLTPTADFVFEKDYNLPKLEEVEKFVKENKHLPEIASAKQMNKEGVNVGEFQIKLLQKVEELTLYSIDLNKKNKEQESLIKNQADLLKSLNDRLEKIEKAKQK